MATTPFPFFPTTAPAYAHTTVFPPPPFGFGAPAYDHHIFPSAATYPPPPYPGSYYISPFPYAATYPYPPPASAYTPAAGFFPAPAYGPSTATSSHAVPPAPTREHLWPPPPPPEATLDTVPLRCPDQDPGAPLPADLSRPTPQLFDANARMEDKAALLAAAQERTQAEDAIHGRRPREHLNNRESRFDQQLARNRASFDTIQGQISRLSEAVSLLVTSVGRPENPISSARPEHDAVSGQAATMKHPTPPVSLGINGLSPTNQNCHFSAEPAAASKLFLIAEINTVAFGSAAMAGNTQHPQGQPIPFGNLQVPMSMQQASSVLGEMPQKYDFNNLCHKTVFLADGAEHSYYALPDTSPLQRADSGLVFDVFDGDSDGCSTESVDVPADLPEQQTYEQEQHESAQPTKCSKANNTINVESMLVQNLQVPTTMQDASSVFKEMSVYDIYEEDNSCLNCMDAQLATPFPKASENALSEQLLTCFSKAPKTDDPSACLNIVIDVLDVTLELQQQDDEKTAHCSVIMASDSVVTWSSHFSIEHCMRELRLLWDPGASAFLVVSLSNDVTNDTIGNEHVGQLVSITGDFSVHDKTDLWSQSEHQFVVLQEIFEEVMLDIPPAKPPDKTVQQLVCYSRMFSSTEAILSAMRMSTITTVHMIVVLSLAQKARDAAVVYHVFKIQLPLSKTSHIWDPGIESLFFSCKRLNITELIQIKGCTSMTYSGNSSSEYPYTMIFLHDQWEFVHRQGVHENYNAKQLLLSSLDCVKIREIGIIFFMTFRPP